MHPSKRTGGDSLPDFLLLSHEFVGDSLQMGNYGFTGQSLGQLMSKGTRGVIASCASPSTEIHTLISGICAELY